MKGDFKQLFLSFTISLLLSIMYRNVHGANGVKQTEIKTVQPVVPKPSPFDSKMAVWRAKKDVNH